MFDRWRKRESPVRVVLATRHVAAVYQALAAAGQPYQVIGEARSTAALYQLLPPAQLVIVDQADLEEVEPAWALLEKVLDQRLTLTSAAFLARPAEWLQQARVAAGDLAALPARTVIVTACAGGTGRTTLAWELARAFRQQTNLPAALVEVCAGVSALAALHHLAAGPTFYDVAMKEEPPTQHQGVTVVPMLRDLADQVPEDLRAATLRRLQAAHVLTVLDAAWPHSYRAALLDGPLTAATWLVTATPQADKLANQAALAEDLRGVVAGPVWRVVNGVRARDRLALTGLDREITLPYIDGDPAKLGRLLLAQIYPGLRV